jgi:predicted CXXCH cytochrome family protein
MRRYHMTVLNHQRDKTVHDGVRAGPFDLKGCIACHAVPGADGKAVTVSDPKHFCRGCHDYAAVSVDCFQCHASRPDELRKSSTGPVDADIAALTTYLEGGKP